MPMRRVLLPFLLVYTAASLFHYSHNAAFLASYPNVPAWLTSTQIYGAWLVLAAVGLAGWLLIRRRHQMAGLIALALYAAAGLYGLRHYALAPPSAHSFTMNLAICLEAATGAALLLVVVGLALRFIREAS